MIGPTTDVGNEIFDESHTVTPSSGVFVVDSAAAYMAAGKVAFDELPRDLVELPQWVAWRIVERNGKPNKVPIQAATGKPASSTDPATWAPLLGARRRYERGKLAGVGFVFAKEGGIVGIDLDGCRDPNTGVLDTWALDIIEACGWPYAEVSPSKTGVKLFGRGASRWDRGRNEKLPFSGRGGKTAGIEVYDQGRYFAVTGWRLTSADREPCPIPSSGWDAIAKLIDAAKPTTAKPIPQASVSHPRSTSGGIGGKLERCWSYVEKMPNAISGRGGHDATFAAACMAFRFGLSDGEATTVLQRFNNSKCDPPWSDHELQHKLASAQAVVRSAGEFGLIGRNKRLSSDGALIAEEATEPKIYRGFSGRDLVAKFPTQRPHIVEGVFRRQEITNIVAAPKMGKSWLAMNLALSVAAGRPWLNLFPCTAERVLLIDNELHPDTLAFRVQAVAQQLGIDLDFIGDAFTVAAVRGDGVSYSTLYEVQEQFGPRDLVVVDAGYRFLEPGQDENDNAAATQNYNLLDSYAKQYDTAYAIVLHTSKGGQGNKVVSDIGAGAGAQSRAADTHLVLIPHEQPDACVLRAIRRSGKAPSDTVLRRNPETMEWSLASDLDPENVAGGAKGSARQTEEGKRKKHESDELKALADIKKWWRQNPGAYSVRELRDKALITNAQKRLPGLLLTLQGQGFVTTTQEKRGGKEIDVYSYTDRPDKWQSEQATEGRRYAEFDDFNERGFEVVESVESVENFPPFPPSGRLVERVESGK